MMRHLVGFFIVTVFLLAGIGCWTVLPAYDVQPSGNASQEWSIAGTAFVLLSAVFAYMTLTIKEVFNHTTYNLRGDVAPPVPKKTGTDFLRPSVTRPSSRPGIQFGPTVRGDDSPVPPLSGDVTDDDEDDGSRYV